MAYVCVMGRAKVNKDAGREAVKLRMEVVQRVRKNKEKTGVPIAVFFERAATEKLDNENVFEAWKKATHTSEEIEAYVKAVKSNGK